jgi:hypothetical protein
MFASLLLYLDETDTTLNARQLYKIFAAIAKKAAFTRRRADHEVYRAEILEWI